VHDFVVVVVCRGMLCLVYCVVYGVVDGCIICMALPGILYWVLCLILCAVDYFLACALERVFSFRGFSLEPLRGLTSAFPGCCASLFGCVSCVFCPGFSHGI
jgi:bacteriorhodopsin